VTDLELPKASGKSFPSSIQNTLLGTRLDAIDHKGQWYPGQVLATQSGGEGAEEGDKECKIRSLILPPLPVLYLP
jgi:hypothetical protein